MSPKVDNYAAITERTQRITTTIQQTLKILTIALVHLAITEPFFLGRHFHALVTWNDQRCPKDIHFGITGLIQNIWKDSLMKSASSLHSGAKAVTDLIRYRPKIEMRLLYVILIYENGKSFSNEQSIEHSKRDQVLAMLISSEMPRLGQGPG